MIILLLKSDFKQKVRGRGGEEEEGNIEIMLLMGFERLRGRNRPLTESVGNFVRRIEESISLEGRLRWIRQ